MKVQIKNLKFQCIIGILKKERKTKQKVIVNIKFNYNYKKQNFIDYSEVAQLVEQNLKKQRFGLIEDAILDTKDLLEYKFNIKKLKIKITKPDILKNCLVSVKS
jgi:dihydroneopterin aldolase